MGVLLIDRESVYDPHASNDRLLLGLKGEFSEMELRILRERSQAAIQEKARRGELHLMISAGYVKSSDGVLRIDPDRRVQQAIKLVFSKFRELGSIRQVYSWFIDNQIDLPIATYKNGHRLEWKLPSVNVLGNLLKNPIYAGAYAYGKTKRVVEIREGRKHVKKGILLPQNQWSVLIHDHHEDYISWDEYQNNMAIIAQNTNRKRPVVTGSAGRGEALLSGILRCGHCGSKLMTRYQGNSGKTRVYVCRGKEKSQCKTCISLGGTRVDEALSNSILEVLSSLGLKAALQASQRISGSQSQVHRQRLLALEQARYEASRAKRQYDAVDPENRLVAAELERDWNNALSKVVQWEEEIALLEQQVKAISEQDRQDILSLAEDLPFVWNHADSNPEIKKKIIRIVIKEIVAYVEQISPDRKIIKLKVHWQGGDHTEIELAKNRHGETNNITSSETKEIISALARIMPDKHIVGCLNRLGKRTASGLTWTPARVCSFRKDHHIPVFKKGEREQRGELTPEEVSHELGVSVSKVRKLIKQGILPAKQVCTGAPWLIQKEDLALDQVRHAAKSPVASCPLTPNSKQGSFIFNDIERCVS
ncbi:MAG: helix-turn-helix domain-containing protein [Gammaproteobacteria bacterium]|nr:helix-turn-helix domain-containing protein [Gammaproteobacteria bacterium]